MNRASLSTGAFERTSPGAIGRQAPSTSHQASRFVKRTAFPSSMPNLIWPERLSGTDSFSGVPFFRVLGCLLSGGRTPSPAAGLASGGVSRFCPSGFCFGRAAGLRAVELCPFFDASSLSAFLAGSRWIDSGAGSAVLAAPNPNNQCKKPSPFRCLLIG